ncbi:MAG: hypothetical protein RL169_1011 [Armatimonadota bacterium]
MRFPQLLCSLYALLCLTLYSSPSHAADKPNILLIVADDVLTQGVG